MMIGLLIVSLILFFGGGPHQSAVLGFHYWNDPGAANTYLASGDTGRFLALLSTWVLSAFPFTFAPELMIVTAGEMKNPRRNLPIAARRYIYRLVFFYVFSVLAIGVICPSDNPAITSGGAGAGASPFVVGIKNAGINVLDSIINAGIIISAWSSGNSFLYLSSRSLYSLALSGNAPAFFKACTKRGVPYRAVACSSLFCALAYLNVASNGAVVFNWFVNLTNESAFLSWICCCIVYLRFRKAARVQGITELPYHSNLQPWGPWVAIVSFVILALLNGYDCFWPQNWSASTFLTAYIGIPIFLVIYFGHRVYAWHDPWAHASESVDLTTGMEQILAEETPPKRGEGKVKWYEHIKRIWE
jgi:amino acid transporter